MEIDTGVLSGWTADEADEHSVGFVHVRPQLGCCAVAHGGRCEAFGRLSRHPGHMVGCVENLGLGSVFGEGADHVKGFVPVG